MDEGHTQVIRMNWYRLPYHYSKDIGVSYLYKYQNRNTQCISNFTMWIINLFEHTDSSCVRILHSLISMPFYCLCTDIHDAMIWKIYRIYPMLLLVDSFDPFTHILQCYTTGTGAIIRLLYCQWHHSEEYGSNQSHLHLTMEKDPLKLFAQYLGCNIQQT